MIGYVTIGSKDIDASCAFYDAAPSPLGYARTFKDGGWAGYGPGGKKEGLEIYIVGATANGEPATFGNGSMLAFKAPSRAAVETFHAAALANGGEDEGRPGVRGEYDPPFYGAYVRDPTGNKFAAYFKGYAGRRDRALPTPRARVFTNSSPEFWVNLQAAHDLPAPEIAAR